MIATGRGDNSRMQTLGRLLRAALVVPRRLLSLLRLLITGNHRELRITGMKEYRRIRDALLYRMKQVDLSDVELEDLGLSIETSRPHESTGGRALLRMFRALNIQSEHRIIDVGAGKGGAMLTMAKFP